MILIGIFFQNISLDLKTAKYQPLRGNSFIETPLYIRKGGVINVQNNDNQCFEYAVPSAEHPVNPRQYPECLSKYQQYLGTLNFNNIDFPVKISNISKFEKQNEELSINVFGSNECFYPLYLSKRSVGRPIDILLIIDKDDPFKSHYICIKDLAQILFKYTKHKHRKHICLFVCLQHVCLHVFSIENLLKSHVEDYKIM